MFISRRNLLRLVAGTLLSGARGLKGTKGSGTEPENNIWQRRYRASATITLLTIPIVSKNDVGSGFILIEEAGHATAIQFGAGSYPEKARGLNRLGFIQEVIAEKDAGEAAECTYFAFMTTSAEKNVEQAKRALESSEATIPYAVAEGEGRDGSFVSKLDHIDLSSGVTWRDYPRLTDQVRAAVAAAGATRHKGTQSAGINLSSGESAPTTFLYAVRTALMNTSARTSGSLIYNAKQFLLRTEKQPDAAMGAHFAERNLVPDASRVILLNARLEECATGQMTSFKVWFESGREHLPPLRFEYQAKSFLRLAFEFDPAASGPPVSSALNKKENT
jgi:hypothetical protein